jgi:histidinol-phosphate/aromatic aminotransferase/cobyric acid decarboxylase-like protein
VALRMLAQELYRCIREVERLEAALAQAPVERRSALERQLAQARSERERMQQVLDGKKDPGAGRSGRM